MSKSGKIIFIEDDPDDVEIMRKILTELRVKNELLPFKDTHEAFTYLVQITEPPFLIFCDMNLPGQNGLQFKKQLDDNPVLRKRSIPFVFYSTSADQASVDKAYSEMTVQGFFEKGVSYEEIRDDIWAIIDYWQRCRHPNTG